ncbi:MAG: ABC transporter ATP-binding protein [Candidatus Hodarchaeota archaeon]
MKTSFLAVETLSKRFGIVEALKNVTFEISNPEIVGLIGPNGAGKTTFIRLLLDLIRPTTGAIHLNGVNCTTDSLTVRQNLGFAHTTPHYPPGVSLAEYLTWLGGVYNIPKEHLAQRIEALLAYFEMTAHAQRALRTFSSGMEVKSALIQAFLPGAPFVVLDEPTANLDPLARVNLLTLIQTFHKEHQVAFLVSSHSLYELEQVCTYYVLLDQGQLVWHGIVQELGEQSLAEFYMETIR